MKLQIALIVLSSIFMTAQAQADCNFGKNTWELEEKFEAPREQHEFYKGETFSLSKEVRLGGLYPYEKELIAIALEAESGHADFAQRLHEFSQTDGYLTYFSHAPSGRQFVQVGHFPGDNEYGAIIEIRVFDGYTEIVGLVAKIQDGDFENCLL